MVLLINILMPHIVSGKKLNETHARALNHKKENQYYRKGGSDISRKEP